MINFKKTKKDAPELIKTVLRALSLRYLVNDLKYITEEENTIHAIVRVSANTDRDFVSGGLTIYKHKLKFYEDDEISSFFIYATNINNSIKYLNLPRQCEGLYLNDVHIDQSDCHMDFTDTSTGCNINILININEIDRVIFKRDFLLNYTVEA